MRTEDVRRLAVECDLDPHDLCEDPRIALRNLERFAALVASTEREACAQVCQERAEECEREAQIAGAAHEHDEAISLRATAWQLTVCAKRIGQRRVERELNVRRTTVRRWR